MQSWKPDAEPSAIEGAGREFGRFFVVSTCHQEESALANKQGP
ncbi:hypothetical protein OAG68_00135 [bacterium]|nr:hypothetical protein [bacterium]